MCIVWSIESMSQLGFEPTCCVVNKTRNDYGPKSLSTTPAKYINSMVVIDSCVDLSPFPTLHKYVQTNPVTRSSYVCWQSLSDGQRKTTAFSTKSNHHITIQSYSAAKHLKGTNNPCIGTRTRIQVTRCTQKYTIIQDLQDGASRNVASI